MNEGGWKWHITWGVIWFKHAHFDLICIFLQWARHTLDRYCSGEWVLWNRHNRLSLCFPGGILHALVSVSLTAGNDQIHHDMWTTKSYKNACLSVHTHTTLHLRQQRAVHYLPRTQAYPHAQGALHVTEHSEIFKHRIQTKKPCQIALLDMKYSRVVDGARAELVRAENFPDKAFW